MLILPGHEEDNSITIDAINESWGQRLLMKSCQLEILEEEKLAFEFGRGTNQMVTA